MDAVTNNQSPRKLWNRFNDFQLEEILSLFTVKFFNHGEGLRFEIGHNFGLQDLKMSFSPFEFAPTVG
jgi:hypothetical protein